MPLLPMSCPRGASASPYCSTSTWNNLTSRGRSKSESRSQIDSHRAGFPPSGSVRMNTAVSRQNTRLPHTTPSLPREKDHCAAFRANGSNSVARGPNAAHFRQIPAKRRRFAPPSPLPFPSLPLFLLPLTSRERRKCKPSPRFFFPPSASSCPGQRQQRLRPRQTASGCTSCSASNCTTCPPQQLRTSMCPLTLLCRLHLALYHKKPRENLAGNARASAHRRNLTPIFVPFPLLLPETG